MPANSGFVRVRLPTRRPTQSRRVGAVGVPRWLQPSLADAPVSTLEVPAPEGVERLAALEIST